MEYDENIAARDQVLRTLLSIGAIEGAAAGITRQVLEQGERSLSSSQAQVFQQQVVSRHLTLFCKQCKRQVDYNEIEGHWHSKMCNDCYASWSSFMKDD